MVYSVYNKNKKWEKIAHFLNIVGTCIVVKQMAEDFNFNHFYKIGKPYSLKIINNSK